MSLWPPSFVAAADGSALDVLFWIVTAVVWIVAQIASAKKKQARKSAPARSAGTPPPAGGGDSPSAEELKEIFRRLGANIPHTPAPPPAPATSAPPALPAKAAPPPAPVRATPPRGSGSAPAARVRLRKPGTVDPELARRLARVKQEAEEAARQAEAVRVAANAVVPGVQSRPDEHRALDTATRHTGTILPRMYAMGVRLAPLPVIPMPGLDRTHHAGPPLRPKLRGRREIRDALVIQSVLRPAKAFAP